MLPKEPKMNRLNHAIGWVIPVELFMSSPFFNGITKEDDKREYLWSVLNDTRWSSLITVDETKLPLWFRDRFAAEPDQNRILRTGDTLFDLIQFIGPSPDQDSHVLFWPSWYGKKFFFRRQCSIDLALYQDEGFLLRELPETIHPYESGYMDLNGVAHHIEVMWNRIDPNLVPDVPYMLRCWISHVGLLDQSRIAALRPHAARFWT